MSDEMKQNGGTTNSTVPPEEMLRRLNVMATEIKLLTSRFDAMEDSLSAAIHANTQTLRTVMVGWNAFLKSAEAQLKVLFRGNIPAPLLRKLVQTAFKGLEDMERKGQ